MVVDRKGVCAFSFNVRGNDSSGWTMNGSNLVRDTVKELLKMSHVVGSRSYAFWKVLKEILLSKASQADDQAASLQRRW
jgi:hypothetical protein